MSPHSTVAGKYGPGTFVDEEQTILPAECRRLLHLFAERSQGFTSDRAVLDDVEFHGADLPIIPGPLKSQAMVAMCHAMIGIVGKELCALRGIDAGKIKIDTDKAGLWPATVALVSINGTPLPKLVEERVMFQHGKDLDHMVLTKTNMRFRSWALYPTKNPQVYYQLLSNLHPVEFLEVYGLDAELNVSKDEAYKIIKAKISEYSADELEMKNMKHGWCGQTVYTPEEWRATSIGQRLAAHPMINYRQVVGTTHLPPVPMPPVNDNRPLAGVKVIELSRIIAGSAAGALLTSLGAEVIKIQSPTLADIQAFSLSLTVGKQTTALDLTVDKDKKVLYDLLEEADVVVQAFRLRSLERKGFGLEDVLEIANKRGRGIVYVDVNCYGPDGYYAERPGYQQIADAATGCSYVCGQAYGFPAGVGVLPPLPVADMLSGAVCVIDVMMALRDRASSGGSYHGTVALAALDTVQLEEVVGLYPPEVVKKIQDTYEFAPMTPDLHVEELLGLLVDAWNAKSDILKRPGYMAEFKTPFGEGHQILSPLINYGNNSATPRWDHGPVPYIYSNSVKWSS